MEMVVTIHELGLEGQGVGRDGEGNLYFVRDTVPGDEVRVQFTETSKRYRDATLLAVVKPSADRIESPCRFFPTCGGCDWMHIAYPAQLQAKERSLAHVLTRADLNTDTVLPTLASPQVFGYRNRVQVRVAGDRVGFLKRGSNDLVAIDRCLVAEDKLNAALPTLRDSSGVQRKVELYSTESGVEKVWDEPHASHGFTQVNSAQNEVMKAQVARWAATVKAEVVLELYCGDGNFSQVLWPIVQEAIGIDLNGAAIAKARERCPETEQKRFLGTAIDGATAGSLPAAFKRRYDTLVLDPPRTGVGKCLKTFLPPSVRNVIYVSCSALTFSWDAKLIVQQGFSLTSLQPVDMFPHTRHLELVALFTRTS